MVVSVNVGVSVEEGVKSISLILLNEEIGVRVVEEIFDISISEGVVRDF